MGGVQDGEVTQRKTLSFILYEMQTCRYNELFREGLIAQLNAHARNAATGLFSACLKLVYLPTCNVQDPCVFNIMLETATWV
jgi:hypothetical protein